MLPASTWLTVRTPLEQLLPEAKKAGRHTLPFRISENVFREIHDRSTMQVIQEFIALTACRRAPP